MLRGRRTASCHFLFLEAEGTRTGGAALGEDVLPFGRTPLRRHRARQPEVLQARHDFNLPRRHAARRVADVAPQPVRRQAQHVLGAFRRLLILVAHPGPRPTVVVPVDVPGHAGRGDDDEGERLAAELQLLGGMVRAEDDGLRPLDEEVAQERYHELMSIQGLISQEVNESLRGKEFEVLIEGRDAEVAEVVEGRSYREAPEVDGQIYIENDNKSKAGDFVRVKILDGFVYDLAAEKLGNRE